MTHFRKIPIVRWHKFHSNPDMHYLLNVLKWHIWINLTFESWLNYWPSIPWFNPYYKQKSDDMKWYIVRNVNHLIFEKLSFNFQFDVSPSQETFLETIQLPSNFWKYFQFKLMMANFFDDSHFSFLIWNIAENRKFRVVDLKV